MRWTVPICLVLWVLASRVVIAAECRQDCPRADRDARGCCTCSQACPREARDARGCCKKAPSLPSTEWLTITLDARRKLGVWRSEVTVRQYRECVKSAACMVPRTDRTTDPAEPMAGVGWREAERFCRSKGGRLPTSWEARWLTSRAICGERPDAGCALGERIAEWVRSESPPHAQIMHGRHGELVMADAVASAIGFRCVR